MKVIVVHGAPCSGKTTYVKERIKDNDLVYDYDELTKALTYGEFNSAEKKATHDYVIAIRMMILNKAKQEKNLDNIYITTTSISNSFKEYISELDVEYVEMEATEEECLQRLDNDDSRKDKEEWKKVIQVWFAKNKLVKKIGSHTSAIHIR